MMRILLEQQLLEDLLRKRRIEAWRTETATEAKKAAAADAFCEVVWLAGRSIPCGGPPAGEASPFIASRREA